MNALSWVEKLILKIFLALEITQYILGSSLLKGLKNDLHTFDVWDAGTAMRFPHCLSCMRPVKSEVDFNWNRPNAKIRPIGILVDALYTQWS